MNKIIYFSIFTLLSGNLLSQTYSSLGRVELGGQGLEIGYSHLLSNATFVKISGGIGAGYNVNDGSAEYIFSFNNPVPFIKGSLNYFYNKEKRLSKNKSIDNNSGNFWGVQTKYSFGSEKDIELNKTLLTELHWGLQRSLGGNFFFNSHLGIGYLYDYKVKNGSINPTVGLSFGYNNNK